jgi:hypothetical protein
MGVCYLPADAGGGAAGSFVFISHDQTGVACENDCRLWRFDLAVAASNPTASPCPAWSYAPAAVSIQNFSFGNGGAQRNAIAYDDKRKGVWILRYSGGGELSFYSFLTGVETMVAKTGDSNWNVTGLDNICLVYHSGKDCLISKDSFMNLCIADLKGFNVASPTGVPCRQFAPGAVGGTIPPSFNGAPDQEDLPEYCPHDGNVWLLDWYSKSEIRFYKLTAPADVLTGTWQWSNAALTASGEAIPQIQAISDGRAQSASFYGRFRYIPAYRAFMWSDDSRLKPQVGRPEGFA